MGRAEIFCPFTQQRHWHINGFAAVYGISEAGNSAVPDVRSDTVSGRLNDSDGGRLQLVKLGVDICERFRTWDVNIEQLILRPTA